MLDNFASFWDKYTLIPYFCRFFLEFSKTWKIEVAQLYFLNGHILIIFYPNLMLGSANESSWYILFVISAQKSSLEYYFSHQTYFSLNITSKIAIFQ